LIIVFALPGKGQNKTELSKDYIKAEINRDFKVKKGQSGSTFVEQNFTPTIKPVQK
jgi:hypothetical protein